MDSLLTIDANNVDGVIRVAGSGMWAPEEARTHFLALEREMKAARLKQGGARVLVDLREAPVQSAATAQELTYWTERVYKPIDRVATVCTAALVSMQIRHQVRIFQFEMFRDRDEALVWLLASPVGRPTEAAPTVRSAAGKGC